MKRKLFKILIFSTAILSFLSLIVLGILIHIWSKNLPYIEALENYSPPLVTEIYSEDGEVVGRFYREKRYLIPIDSLPRHVIYSFIAAEDSRFFKHEGIDIRGIFRAFLKNIKAGKIEQGGSTITQQITKSILLKDTSRTIRRKLREALLALEIERRFPKQYILYLYLNQIYLGEGAYGIEAAARTYFGKHAKELTLSEASLIAGLTQAPSRYSPFRHPERAKVRQRYVLRRMKEEGFITEEEMKRALNEGLNFKRSKENVNLKAPYYTDYIKRYVIRKYGEDALYEGGLKIYIPLNYRMHLAAKKALEKGLRELDKREGYRGPIKRLNEEEITKFLDAQRRGFLLHDPSVGKIIEAVVEDVDRVSRNLILGIGDKRAICLYKDLKWAAPPDPKIPYWSRSLKDPQKVFKRGDVVLVRLKDIQREPWLATLEQEPAVQGAILCMEAKSGRVKVMIGGRDFLKSQFNRCIQARRQPGSAFKPIIYCAALDKGIRPSDIFIDAPIVELQGVKGRPWKPKNYKERFYGPTILRVALAKSRNVITVKLLKRIGVDYVINYAKRLGIQSPLGRNLSLALGSSEVTLLELTRAYAVFANGGILVNPIFIDRIEDRDRNIIEENTPKTERVISPETAYVMTDLLKAVIQEGTGFRIKALKRPVAGKTGTTNNLRDAWFMGYTPSLVTGVWVGYDENRSMGIGETGSRAASPIWLYFMKEILKGKPIGEFSVPMGVVFAKIDLKTGLLAGPDTKRAVFQAFKKGTEPKRYTKSYDIKSEEFLRFDLEGEAR